MTPPEAPPTAGPGDPTPRPGSPAPEPPPARSPPARPSPHRHKEPPKEPDEENEDGDFTVYECPGLAPVSVGGAPSSWGAACCPAAPGPDPPSPLQTGEMEVRNPLFDQASLAAPPPPLPPPPK